MKYDSQGIAKPFVVYAIILFATQLAAGALLALYQLNPWLLTGYINFNVARAFHLNAMVLWIFAATLGAVFYVIPLVSGRDLPKFTWAVAAAYPVVATGILASFPLFQSGFNIWFLGQPMLVEGREWVEAGRLWDIMYFAILLVSAAAILKTLPRPKTWSRPLWQLVIGLIFIVLLYVPGNIFLNDLTLSEFLRWWTVHYWVEWSLEIAFVGAIGIILMLMVPDPRVKGLVGKFVVYDAILVSATAILGQGHHYFWIGTPTFWILIGGIAGVLEFVPLTLMIIDVYRIATKLKIENKPSFYHLTGIFSLGFVGPALFGLVQTWPWTNWWMHGTWVTPRTATLGFWLSGWGRLR